MTPPKTCIEVSLTSYLLLVCICATGLAFNHDYRLPPFPAITISNWDCVDVPTMLHLDPDIPLALQQYVNSTTHSSSFEWEGASALEFAKAHAIKQAYEPFIEFLFWLDNLHVGINSILERRNQSFVYFNNTMFQSLLMKSASHGIAKYLLEKEVHVSPMELDIFFERLPFVVFASMKNQSKDAFALTNQSLEEVQLEKVFGVMGLLSNESDIANLTQQFTIDLNEIKTSLETIFSVLDTLEISTTIEELKLPNGISICLSPDNEWPGKIISQLLLNISNLFEQKAMSISTFVEDKLRDWVKTPLLSHNCTSSQCWVRNPNTSIAWPIFNPEKTAFGSNFFVFYTKGKDFKQPNPPIVTPYWCKTYLYDNKSSRMVKDLTNEISILSFLYRYFEIAYDFLSWCFQVRDYAVGIFTNGDIKPFRNFSKETFYQTFMELGLYILQRNAVDVEFPVGMISELSLDIFKIHFDFLDIKDMKTETNKTVAIEKIFNESLSDLFVLKYNVASGSYNLEGTFINKSALLEIVRSFENIRSQSVPDRQSVSAEVFSPIKQEKQEVIPSLDESPDSVQQIISEFIGRLRHMYDNLTDTWSIHIQTEGNHKKRSFACNECHEDGSPIVNLTYVSSFTEQPCINSWAVGHHQEPVLREFVTIALSKNYTSLINDGFSLSDQQNNAFTKDQRIVKMTLFQIIFEQIFKYSFLLRKAEMKLANMDGLQMNELVHRPMLSTFQEEYRLVTYQAASFLSDDAFETFLRYSALSIIHSYFQSDKDQLKVEDMEQTIPLKYHVPPVDIGFKSSTNDFYLSDFFTKVTEKLAQVYFATFTVKYNISVSSESGINMSNVCPIIGGSQLGRVHQVVNDFNNDLLILAKELEEYVNNVSNGSFDVSPTVSTALKHTLKDVNSSEITRESSTITNDRTTESGRTAKAENTGSTTTEAAEGGNKGRNEQTTREHEDGDGDKQEATTGADGDGNENSEKHTTRAAGNGNGEMNEQTTEEGNEGGGQNNEEETTEGNQETRQYRASQQPNGDNMGLVLSGNQDELHVSLDFHSREGDFRGVTEEDFTFTFENVESYKSEANIRATANFVSENNSNVDVYVDASASWTLKMAVKGTTVQDTDTNMPLNVSFKVKHSAPTCIQRRFTNTGNAIEFRFDVPVNVTRTADGGCSDFFEDTSKLGDGATCEMKGPRLLVVTVGRGSSLIEPGDTLTFKRDAINPARQLFYNSLNNEYDIEGPESPLKPSFTISGLITINECGTYTLRAEQITGHGGRPVTYHWQLQTQLQVGSGLNSEFFSDLNEGRGSPSLVINAEDLQAGQQYNFLLEITNFLDEKTERSFTLSVADGIKPLLEIKPVNVIPDRVRLTSRVKLEAVFTFTFGNDCKSSINAPTYEWNGPDDLIPADLREDRVLVLPPNILPVNQATEITVTVTYTPGSSNAEPKTVTESIILTTIPSPLVAQIKGATKVTLGPRDSVLLNGSMSFDPDETDSDALTFEWTCLPKGSSQSCTNRLGNELTRSTVSAQASQFEAGTYFINLSVIKGERTATASVTLIIKEESVPTIKIKTRSGKIKFGDNENVYIQANVISSSAVSVAWSESNDRLDPALWEYGEILHIPDGHEYRTHVKIPSSLTTAGSQYTIEVVTTDQNGKSGAASFDFSIYEPITQCEVIATPYIEMKEITISATSCVADEDFQPLLYQPVFAVRLENGYKKIVLGSQKGDSSQTVVATPIEFNGENVTVGFEVCEANLVTCRDFLTTTRYESSAVLSDEEREVFIAEKIDKELETGNIVTAFSNSINIVNMQKKQLKSERRKRRDQFSQFSAEIYVGSFDSVLLVTEELTFDGGEVIKSQFDELGRKQTEVLQHVGPTDFIEGASILDLSSLMPQSTFNKDDFDETLKAVGRIINKSEEEGLSYSVQTMERMFTTLASSSTNLKDLPSEEKEPLRKTIRDLRKAGLKQLGQDLSIGDHITLTVSGTKISIVCFLPENDTAVDESADLPVTIRPGKSIAESYQYDWCSIDGNDDLCSGVKLLVIPFTEIEEDFTSCSDLTDITLVNPVTDSDVPVSDLADPIEIEMTTVQVQEGQRCVCRYWNESTSRLDSGGMTSELTTDGKLICRSSHLTAFVGEVVYDSSQTPGPDPTMGGETKTTNGQLGLILGIVFGVLVVILLVVIVGVVIFKVTQQKKVSPRGE